MLLDPHVGLIIWTIITFVVVLYILKSKAWGPLLKALDEREQGIRDALASADRAKLEAQEALQANQKILQEARSEARQIIQDARAASAKVGQDIVDKAQEKSQQLEEQARRTIENEKRVALTELRREVADLAVQAAGTIIDANLDNEQNRKLVDDLINNIPASNN
jgi:F-type H+-transporting ATPase subunit b